jgi:flagellar biosynthesis protein FlhF
VEQFVEQGSTYDECLEKVRRKWGDRAKVMNYRTVRIGGIFGGLFAREGVEITGYIASDFRYGAGVFSGAAAARQGGSAFQAGGSAAAAGQTLDFEEEKRKILAVAPVQAKQSDPMLQKLFNEVKTLTEKIDAAARPPGAAPGTEHPTHGRREELLDQNDFSPAYVRLMLERVRKEFSLEDLEDFDLVQERVVDWIGETIRIYPDRLDAFRDGPRRGPRILVLVGPTGVGKTTTIAKLAAAYGVRDWAKAPLRVAMVTIDGYRIAAMEQLKKYGDIMKIPVAFVHNDQELRKTLALYQDDADLILVDTIGKSPRDAVVLGRMKQLLDACGSAAETHLAISSGVKFSDIREILRQFAPFNYQAVAVTKLDETLRVGNVISALFADGKPVSYLTDGQGVEKNIHRASVVRFLMSLEGFVINREAIEERFPRNGGPAGRVGEL